MLENASYEIYYLGIQCTGTLVSIYLEKKSPSEIACGEQPSVQGYTSELLCL